MRTPYYDTAARANPNTTNVQILMACQIARRYSRRMPTWQQLCADFGMSRATAYRWVSALKVARGIEKAPTA